MKVYFVPFACSLAVRIALEEAGIEAEYVQVGDRPASTAELERFAGVSPLRYVPAVVLPSGESLTEGPAILQYIADLAPAARLAPPAGTIERARLQQWLNFTSSELHKGTLGPLIGKDVPAEVRQHARANLAPRMDIVAAAIGERPWLLADFSVADAYLLSVLNWCETAKVDIGSWPALKRYRDNLRARPSVARSIAIEARLYAAR